MGRVIAGIVILLCGIVFFMNAAGFTEISVGALFSTFFWPFVFIVAGLCFLFGRQTMSFSRLVFGLILMFIGILFLGNNYGWFDFAIRDVWQFFWPALLILIGLNLLARSRKGQRNWAVLGSVDKRSHTWNLKHGDYWAFMGGVDLDLRTAVIPDGETTISATAFMGGINVTVPHELAVICEGSCIFGGLSFFGREHGGVFASNEAHHGDVENSSKVVRIKCNTIMGGIKVVEAGGPVGH